MLSMLVASAAHGQSDQLVVQPRAHEGADGYFGNENYPAAARKAGAQGRVVARLDVSKWGDVTGCAVTASSGSADLDAATCRIARQRVRFSPARDEKGRPVSSTYTLPVRWVLPGDRAAMSAQAARRPDVEVAPAEPGDLADVGLVLKGADPAGQVVTVSLEVDERGKLAACDVVASTGSPAIAARACREIGRKIAFRPALKAGVAVRRTTVQRVLFRPPTGGKPGQRAPETPRVGEPEGWVASADYPLGARRLGKQGATVIAWDVTEAGTVENCHVTSSSGFAEFDRAACDAVTKRARFTPALDAVGKPTRSTRSQSVRWTLPR